MAEAPAAPPPSTELLMYLAEFEDAEGEHLDPMALEAPEAGALAGAAEGKGDGKDEEDDERD